MKILQMSDDSGFLGIANYDKYDSFLSPNWDFEMMQEKIVNEMNSHHLLFWGTGMENVWKIKIDTKDTTQDVFREERGVIEVTNKKLYLTNYETLTMAAQFGHIKLPEKHQENLSIELPNGKYMIKFRQLINPNNLTPNSEVFDFEIILSKISNMSEIHVNNFRKIFWY